VHPLLEEATGEPYAVLHLIYSEFDELGEWPLWQYVEGKLDPAGTGKTTSAVESMPRVSAGQMGWGYGWLWWEDFARSTAPHPHQQVQITVGGLWAIRLDALPKLYVGLLGLCNESYAHRDLKPTMLVTAKVTADDAATALFPGEDDGYHLVRPLDRLRLIAKQERPTFGRVGADGTKGYWEVTVPDSITRYADVESVEDYLNRLVEEIEPPPPQPVPAPVSPPAWRRLFDRLASRTVMDNVISSLVVALVLTVLGVVAGFLAHLW
jgi:hypothetical protein